MSFNNIVLDHIRKEYNRKDNKAVQLKSQALLFWITLFAVLICNIAYLMVRVFRMGVPANSIAPFVFIFIYCGACIALTIYNIANKLKITVGKQCVLVAAVFVVPMIVFLIYFCINGLNVILPSSMLGIGCVLIGFRISRIRKKSLKSFIALSIGGLVLAVLSLLFGLFLYSGTDRRASTGLERTVTYKFIYGGYGGCTVERVWRTLGDGAEVVLPETVHGVYEKNANLVGINSGAFDGYTHTVLSIPQSIMELSDNAFTGSSITSLDISGGMLLKASDQAFSDSSICEIITDRNIADFGNALGNVGDNAVTVRLDNPDCRLSFDKATIGENVVFEVVKEKLGSFRSVNSICADRFVPIVEDDEIYITFNDSDGSMLDGFDTVIGKLGIADANGEYKISVSIPDGKTRRTLVIDGDSRDEQLVFVGNDNQNARACYISEAIADGTGDLLLTVSTPNSLRLYANWSPVYTVKFDFGSIAAKFIGDEFDGHDMEFYDDLDGISTTIALPTANDISCAGYAFIGWYRRGSLPREYYGEYNGYDSIDVTQVTDEYNEDLVLIADFREYFNVVLNGMGVDMPKLISDGEVVLSDNLVDSCKYHELSGEIILPRLDDSVRPGFVFDGWYISAQNSFSGYFGNAINSIEPRSSGHKFYYAKWTMKSPNVESINYVDKVYDGKSHNIGVTAVHDCGQVVYDYSWSGGASETSANVLAMKDVGSDTYSVTVTARLAENVEYIFGFDDDGSEKMSTASISYSARADAVNVFVEIGPAQLTVVWDNGKSVYDGSEKTLSAHLQNEPIVGEHPQIVLNGNKATNAGTYTASASSADKNYTVTNSSSTYSWMIEKADYDMSHVVFYNVSFVYDGSEHRPMVDETSLPLGANSGDALSVGSYSGGAVNVSDGRKAVTVTFIPSANYNTPSPMTAYVTITARAVTVTADNKSSVYGDDIVTLTAQVMTGSIVNGDSDPWSLSTTANKTSNVGTYDIVGIGNDSNYNITINNGSYTIMARTITVIADNKSGIYGNEIVELTARLKSGNIVNGDSDPWSLSTTANKTSNVGTYDIVGIGNNSNYNVTVEKGLYTISKVMLVVIWGEWETSVGQPPVMTGASVVIGGTTVALTVSVSYETTEDGFTDCVATAGFSSSQSAFSQNYYLTDVTTSIKYKEP